MVKIMENPIEMDDLEENPPFLETSRCFKKKNYIQHQSLTA